MNKTIVVTYLCSSIAAQQANFQTFKDQNGLNQDYKEFISIESEGRRARYQLTGRYGPNAIEWFGVYAYIDLIVEGPAVPTDYRIVTWAEIDNPYSSGDFEAFECVTRYDRSQPFVEWHDITVRSYTGYRPDSFRRSTWLPDKEDIWTQSLTWLEDRYLSTYNSDLEFSSQSCFAMRKIDDINSQFAIKEGLVYKVRSGYQIHDKRYALHHSAIRENQPYPLEEANGVEVEILFDGLDIQLQAISCAYGLLAASTAIVLS